MQDLGEPGISAATRSVIFTAMADDTPPDELPVATARPHGPEPRAIVIDPVVVIAGGAVALLGIILLAAFLWMVPNAAARESVSACRGMRGFDRLNPALCPNGVACSLPVPAPEFKVVDHTGREVKLSDFRGKVVLLNFWASWCGVCKTEKPSLAAMTKDLQSDDFVVLTIASDKNWGAVKVASIQSLHPEFRLPRAQNGEISEADAHDAYGRALPEGLPYHVYLDPPNGDDTIGPITQSWGIKAVPESALIDRDGKIRAYFVNKRDWESSVAQTCLRSVIDG
jgi:thiol-disulfide isomerase/thioredoxin